MKQIGIIQVLRAVAAMMIVFTHAQNDAAGVALQAGTALMVSTLLPWASGVHLFFVISGFIMVYASERLFATKGATVAFLVRRVIRIVPLYWLCTAVALAGIALVVWVGKRSFPSAAEIGSSLAFFPFARPEDGAPRPIVPLGWTLNYEMFFYLVFGLFVGLRRKTAVIVTGLVLAAMVGLGTIVQPSATVLAFWSDPILLEFVLGMGVALAYRDGLRLPPWLVPLVVAASIVVLALDLSRMGEIGVNAAGKNGWAPFFACGVPMALIFAALVLSVSGWTPRGRIGSAASLLGDASYALYLFHPLAIIFVRKAYLALGLMPALGLWPLVWANMLAAPLLAVLIHLVIEKPVTGRLQARFKRVWASDPQPKIAAPRTV